jgi:multidrug efflux pump subunit AcrB
MVYKKAEGNIIKVVKDIRAKVKEYNAKFKNLDIQVRNDGSENVKKSIRTLSQNALMGIILVFITL